MVIATIEQSIGGRLDRCLTRPNANRKPRIDSRYFLRCAVHLYHHVGQINYLSRELTQK